MMHDDDQKEILAEEPQYQPSKPPKSNFIHRRILDAIPNPYLVLDKDGTVLLCNEQADRMFASDDLTGQQIRKLYEPEFMRVSPYHTVNTGNLFKQYPFRAMLVTGKVITGNLTTQTLGDNVIASHGISVEITPLVEEVAPETVRKTVSDLVGNSGPWLHKLSEGQALRMIKCAIAKSHVVKPIFCPYFDSCPWQESGPVIIEGLDRRRDRRITSNIPVSFRLAVYQNSVIDRQNARYAEGKAIDLSENGIRIASEVDMPSGMIIALRLANERFTAISELKAEVKRSVKLTYTCYATSAMFLDLEPDQRTALSRLIIDLTYSNR